jgi:hypothetical protein
LRDDRVWLFSGGKDTVVDSTVMERLAAFYGQWIAPSAIRFVQLPEAGHAMISIVDPQANACSSEQTPFINRCGELRRGRRDAPATCLAPCSRQRRPLSGEMLRFDQSAVRRRQSRSTPDWQTPLTLSCRRPATAMPAGYMSSFMAVVRRTAQIGRRFVDGAGYNRWADSNRIIVLYPQVQPRYGLTHRILAVAEQSLRLLGLVGLCGQRLRHAGWRADQSGARHARATGGAPPATGRRCGTPALAASAQFAQVRGEECAASDRDRSCPGDRASACWPRK